jgi:pimeloyl-ACP methyl ester carboxylesterase
MRSLWIGSVIIALGAPLVAEPAIGGEGRFASVNGTRLYYEQTGSGPDVVLIHGLSLDRRMWAPQMPALSGFRVTAYDVRGFGKSARVVAGHDPTDDLLALLDHLAIDRAYLVGMSMGGRIALDFALSHPRRVARLVLIGADMSGFPHPDWGPRVAPIFEAASKGDLVRAKELWLHTVWLTPVRETERLAPIVRQIVEDCPCNQLADPSLIPGGPSPSAFERLEELAVPTLTIVGEKDDPDMLAMANAVERRV